MDFAARVQALPQELQDVILEEVITVESDHVLLTWDYKPPCQLAINKETRRKFAEKYYKHTIFGFECDLKFLDGAPGSQIAQLWILSLEPQHLKMVNVIRSQKTREPAKVWEPSVNALWVCTKLIAEIRLGYMYRGLERRGVRMRRDVFELCYLVKLDDGSLKLGWTSKALRMA